MAVKKAYESFSKSLIDEVHKWGCLKQTGVSLRYMMEFGSRPTNRNLLISAQFLHKELPIRIARRAIELESLPYGLSLKPAVLKVLSFFLSFFFFFFCFWLLTFHNSILGFLRVLLGTLSANSCCGFQLLDFSNFYILVKHHN